MSNDAFADAISIGSLPTSMALDTTDATLESAEPQPCASIGATLWYTWTAPEDAPAMVSISTDGSSFDTAVAAYTGSSLDALTNLGCDDDAGSGVSSYLAFAVTPGETYRLQLGGYNGQGGVMELAFAPYEPCAADCDGDGDGYTATGGDCDDTASWIFPGAYDAPGNGVDEDCDGADSIDHDADGDGYTVSSDCNDSDASIFPGAPDSDGDGIDQDCDGADGIAFAVRGVAPGSGLVGTTVYVIGASLSDVTLVLFGGENVTWTLVDDSQLTFTVPALAPGNYSIDVYTNEMAHFECCFEVLESDADGDGYAPYNDCDDGDANVHPGAHDIPENGVDEDCEGGDALVFYVDGWSPSSGPAGTLVTITGEGFHHVTRVVMSSTEVAWSADSSTQLTLRVPDLGEGTYGIDLEIPSGFYGTCCFELTSTSDFDGDGWYVPSDCDDSAYWIHPGAYDEPNNGVDEDCDGADTLDMDADGWRAGEDCDDSNPEVHPGAFETPNNGVDEDCDGADAIDADQDGWWTSSDCDDQDPAIHPYAYDRPGNGVDEDCDGIDDVVPAFTATLRVYDSSDVYRDDAAAFGVQDGATGGYDHGVDSVEPPAPADPSYVRAYFAYPEQNTSELSTSIVAGALELSYPLRVEWLGSPSDGHSIGILWRSEDLAAIPSDWSVYLVDGGTLIDMRQDPCCWSSHTFFSWDASGTRDFEILVTTAVRHEFYLSSGWSLVSIPVTPFDPSVGAVFGSQVDAVYAWHEGAYVPVTEVGPGLGYWVHNAGGDVLASTVGEPVHDLELALVAGWNLVGAPYGGGSLEGAPSQVSRTTWYWHGVGYSESVSTLYEGHGHWVYSHEDGAYVPLAAMPAADVLGLLAPAEPTVGEFTLPFALSDGERGDGAVLAARLGASDGYEASTDVMEAPRPAADAWAQLFVKDGRARMHRSTVSAVSEATHALRLERAGAAGEATLSWAGAELPEGYVVELVLGETRVDMRAQSAYTLALGEGLTTLDMQVVLRAEDAPVCLMDVNGDCAAGLPFDPLARLGRVLP